MTTATALYTTLKLPAFRQSAPAPTLLHGSLTRGAFLFVSRRTADRAEEITAGISGHGRLTAFDADGRVLAEAVGEWNIAIRLPDRFLGDYRLQLLNESGRTITYSVAIG